MATPKNNRFGSLTAGIIANSNTPQPAPEVEAPKYKVTSFELKEDLRAPLARIMHGLGRKEGTLKNVLNMALEYLIENDPDTNSLANTPTPDEKKSNRK